MVLKTFLQLVSFGTLRTAACRADAPLPLWLSEYAADSFRVTVRQNLFVFATSAKRVKLSSKSSTTLRYQWLETSMKACLDFSSLNPCMGSFWTGHCCTHQRYSQECCWRQAAPEPTPLCRDPHCPCNCSTSVLWVLHQSTISYKCRLNCQKYVSIN